MLVLRSRDEILDKILHQKLFTTDDTYKWSDLELQRLNIFGLWTKQDPNLNPKAI